MRWYSDSGVAASSRNRNGVIGLPRQAGVGVDMANGSDEDDEEPGREAEEDAQDDMLKSSKAGGDIPSSVYSQSIWIKVVDNCDRRLV